jgi:hypothetical protein
METPFTQLNLSGIEHVWVEYHVAESLIYFTRSTDFVHPISHLCTWYPSKSCLLLENIPLSTQCSFDPYPWCIPVLCTSYGIWGECSAWRVECVSTMMYSCALYILWYMGECSVWSVYPPWCILYRYILWYMGECSAWCVECVSTMMYSIPVHLMVYGWV